MTFGWQLMAQGLTPAQRAVRDRFQEGGSITQTLLIFTALIFAVLLLYLLNLRSRVNTRREAAQDPVRLFADLLARLGLSTQQRDVLTAVVGDLRLKDPTLILVSPALFDKHLQQWRAQKRRAGRVEDYSRHWELLAQTRRMLFSASRPG